MKQYHPLKVWRFNVGKTQQELADVAQTSVARICEIERGTKRPSVATAKRIAEQTGLTLDEIFSTPEQAARSSPMPASLPRRR